MITSKFKKCLSLMLSVLILLTMFPATIFSFAADESYPVMEKFNAASSTEFHAYYNSIYSVTFLDKIDWNDINASYLHWDSSANNDNSVIAYIRLNDEQSQLAGANRYDLYIAGDGGVGANPDSRFIFYFFSALEEVRGCENFKTSNATSFYGMFYNCKKLRSITGINWDTSNVTDMSYMFRDCYELTELDLSSFNTSKVTTMKYMFYYCKNLEHIYVGPGWTTESIANLNDGVFNCCYAIVGGKENYDKNFQYFPPGAEYARLKEDGGFLDLYIPKYYNVTYSFIGNTIPDGVTAPEKVEYKEGSRVAVAGEPSADHYLFSGWSTEDTSVNDGEFTISNDVHFVGSWEKLYKVEYRYTEGFPVPDGAPELPEAVYYKAGDLVDVNGVAYVDGYLFIGWSTEDADIAGYMFDMPENDVVLYGYFKKPVQSVEFDLNDITIKTTDDAVKVNVYVKPDDATIKDIVYTSSDESVVTVDKYGFITPVGEGTATVTVASKDDPTKSDTITVTVKIPAEEITVDKTEITLNKGETDKITATVTPDNATDKEIIYKSDDETIVTVDENGNVTAVGEGTTTITVISKDNPDLKEEIKVSVKVPVTEVTAAEDFTINVGEEKSLEAKTNDDATNKELIYESSDSSVVKVNNDGTVVGVGEGTATITITSKDDPSKTETVEITVKIPVIGIEPEDREFFLNPGDKDKIEITVNPENATNKEVIFESSDETIVKVDENGNIEAVGEGEATITVSSKDDPSIKEEITVNVILKKYNVTYKYIGEIPEGAPSTPAGSICKEGSEVIVEAAPLLEGYSFSGWSTTDATVTDGKFKVYNDVELVGSWEKIIINVEKITVDKTEITIKEGETDKITAIVTPENATNKEITFESSDETIVRVDENGNLEAVGEGEVTITISSKDGNTSTTVTVKVEKKDTPVEPDEPEKPEYTIEVPDGINVYEGETVNLGVKVNPEGYLTPTYTSADASIVTVDAEGNIKGIKAGATTITVDFGNGEIRVIPVVVLAPLPIPRKHYVAFGKTDGIGWYEVSVNGGDFFPQGPNSTLEVEEGSVLVVRVQDMWIDDEFDFYVNGKKVPMDPANTITVVVDGYMLIGALSMDAEVPDVEESLSLLDKIRKAFTDFINWIKSLFQ